MNIDKNMLNRIKKDLENKKQQEKDKKHIFFSYLGRKGYEVAEKEMKRRIGRCDRDIENYEYLEYIINELEKEKGLHNLDTLDTQKIKVCVKIKDYKQERLSEV